MKLLTIGNPKTVKGQKKGFLTAVLHLAPHTLSGHNVCPLATPGCAAACLNTAGRGGIGLDDAHPEDHPIQGARIRRTRWYFEDRRGFMAALVKDVEAVIRKAAREGLTPCIRLNGTSDIRWENVLVKRGTSVYGNIMHAFPDVQFYDYTKLPNRRGLPPNYHLTYSLAETDRNRKGAELAFENGYNVAVVLRGCGDSTHPKPLPKTWRGRKLLDGDESDLRFLDGRGNYVGLRAKGRAKNDDTGFVYDAREDS